MTRVRGELPEPEEQLLGIERPTLEQEAEAEKRRAEEAELERLFLVGMMENPRFRTWLMGWLESFGTFENAFGSGPTGFPDPLATQFKLGMKAAGWAMFESVDSVTPELTSRMRREWRKPL